MSTSGQLGNNKNKILNIVLIGISLIIAFNIYKKQELNMNSLKANIVEEEKKNHALVNIGKLGAKIDAYKSLLPRRETSTFINDITTTAKNSGVAVLSIKPSGEESSPEYTKYIFDLTVNALDYDSLARFINNLEVHPTVYMIDILDIRSPSFNREKALNANLRVSTVAILE